MNTLTIEQILRTLAAVDSSSEVALQLDLSIYPLETMVGLSREEHKAYSIAVQAGTPPTILIRPKDPLGARLCVGLALNELLRAAATGART
jgi:hypothetical protein